MSKTMLALLAVLVAVMLAIAFDSPAGPAQVVEVAERRERQRRIDATSAAPIVQAAPGADADSPIPDLFAGAAQGEAEQTAAAEAPAGAEAAAPAFGLIGFKEEEGVREAYLLRNGAVLTARTGAMLEQRYRVQALRGDTVHIKDTRSGEILLIGYGEEE